MELLKGELRGVTRRAWARILGANISISSQYAVVHMMIQETTISEKKCPPCASRAHEIALPPTIPARRAHKANARCRVLLPTKYREKK
jgi:hypothetical protein